MALAARLRWWFWFAAACGCRPQAAELPAETPAAEVPEVSPSEAPAHARPARAAAERCVPPLPPPPPGGLAGEGPAWVLVEHVGVLRIDAGEVTTVLPPGKDVSRWGASLLASDAGELWLSDWEGLHRVGRGGEVRRVSAGPQREALALRGADELWAVTSEIEWSVGRLEGSRWTRARGRGDFRGRYEDNKFEALALTAEAVWVSSWNGLWRGAGGDWQKVEPPDASSEMLDLWVYRGRLIAGDVERFYMREGTGWRALRWPREDDVRRAVSDVGLVAAPTRRGAEVRIAAIEGEGCAATSDAIAGNDVLDLAIDEAGRVWVATDRGLAVLERDGRVTAAWTQGQLPGLTGRILGVAVSGAGPRRLPPAQTARTRDVVGRLRVYKSGAPLANAAVELCSAIPVGERCPDAAFVRRATSAADGGFRFREVPDGEFRLLVRPPHDAEGCDGLFRDTGGSVEPARDCPGAGECDLGELEQCLPFEMPPPPPGQGGSH